MNSPLIAAPLSGNVIGSAGNNFVIAEWRDPGGPVGEHRLIAPFHVHRSADEAWYVLEGTLCVRSGEDEIRAEAGSAVLVLRGTPHTYWNPGPGPVRYLLVMAPNIFRLLQEIHATSDRSRSAIATLFRKHDSGVLAEQSTDRICRR
jgi:mannose-6-phosphate isomerase-like protein (cupin superfamily)